MLTVIILILISCLVFYIFFAFAVDAKKYHDMFYAPPIDTTVKGEEREKLIDKLFIKKQEADLKAQLEAGEITEEEYRTTVVGFPFVLLAIHFNEKNGKTMPDYLKQVAESYRAFVNQYSLFKIKKKENGAYSFSLPGVRSTTIDMEHYQLQQLQQQMDMQTAQMNMLYEQGEIQRQNTGIQFGGYNTDPNLNPTMSFNQPEPYCPPPPTFDSFNNGFGF